MRDLFELLCLYALIAPLGLPPIGAGRKAGEALGLLAYHVLRGKRRRATANIAAVAERGGIDLGGRTPESIARGAFVHVGRSLAEMAKILMGGGNAIAATVRAEGAEHFAHARARGRGVIFVTGHMGNWELSSLTLPRVAGEIWGVARRQKNPYINRLIERMRRTYGGHVVYQEGALRTLLSVLASGGTVGVVMDETVRPGHGVEVEFMGGREYKPRLCAALARRTGAAVVPVLAASVRGETVVRIHPALQLSGDEAADTRAVMRVFEDHIRAHPDQWLLWLRNWWRGRKRKEAA